MFVTITIFFFGLLYWICYAFSLAFIPCLMLDPYWFSARFGNFTLFTILSLAFVLIFIWNFAVFFGFKTDEIRKQKRVTGTFFLANSLAILLIGFTLFRFSDFVGDYRMVHYQEVEGAYIPINDYWGLADNNCLGYELFSGKWNIVDDQQENPRFKNYINFSVHNLHSTSVYTDDVNWYGGGWDLSKFDKHAPPHDGPITKIASGHKAVVGYAHLYEYICDEAYCEWKTFRSDESFWYYELTESQLILIETDSDYVLSESYLVLERDQPDAPTWLLPDN